jgi:hypothetical protein
VEGNSVRSTSRLTGVAKGTILRLLVVAGKVAAEYQDGILRNLPCKLIQCDEIWSFVEQSAEQFIGDVASRLSSKVQMTTDGLKLYLNATEGAFGGAIDYAMLTKLYGASGNDTSAETRTHRAASRGWNSP